MLGVELSTRPIVVVGALILLGATVFTLDWLLTSRKTDVRKLEPPSLVRSWRGYRWFWLRMGLDIFGWPHLFDVALGTSKHPWASGRGAPNHRIRTATEARRAKESWRQGLARLKELVES